MRAVFDLDAELKKAGVGKLMSKEAIKWHQPVMVEEVVEALHPKGGAVIVDGTLGTGGHSLALLPHLLPDGEIIAIDRDVDALNLSRQRLREWTEGITFIHGDVRNIAAVLKQRVIHQVDGLLLDLGMSSLQVDDPQRGFSFTKEGPLDMRMDRTQTLDAQRLIHESSAEEIEYILETFGEERFARRIANKIVQSRVANRITSTTDLIRLIVSAVPSSARHGRLHIATRTFQALRIAVNDEFGALRDVLKALPGVLKSGGRAAIISYQSVDDRLVKHAFADSAKEGIWTVLTKKPLRPTKAEVAMNPRARSAKLRVIERNA